MPRYVPLVFVRATKACEKLAWTIPKNAALYRRDVNPRPIRLTCPGTERTSDQDPIRIGIGVSCPNVSGEADDAERRVGFKSNIGLSEPNDAGDDPVAPYPKYAR